MFFFLFDCDAEKLLWHGLRRRLDLVFITLLHWMMLKQFCLLKPKLFWVFSILYL